ncbi:MAG: hypothetical protein ACI4XF_03295 [Oscillospiraceae bacterium]
MILQIAAGAVFAVTILLAAKDIPPKTRLSAIIAGAVLAAADIFMLTRFSAASGEYEELILFLNENKQASVDMLPAFLTTFAAGVHNVIIGAAQLLQSANAAVHSFFDSASDIAAFGAAALILSEAYMIIVPDKEDTDSESVGPAKAIGMIVLDLFSDSFFMAPAAAVIVYGFCCLLDIEYAAVICTALWVLSYIPIIGQAGGIILGACILIAACHPVWGIAFGVFSAVVYILLNNGKNIIAGLLEVKEQEKTEES